MRRWLTGKFNQSFPREVTPRSNSMGIAAMSPLLAIKQSERFVASAEKNGKSKSVIIVEAWQKPRCIG